MKIKNNQSGFTIVEAIIIVVIVAGLGFAGYKVYQNRHHKAGTSTTVASTTSPVSFPSSIKNSSDLKQASQALTAQPISSKLNPTQLDGYVKSLL